jgi:predicted ATPase
LERLKMAKQARVRPSWNKQTPRAIKRARELFNMRFDARAALIVERNGTGSSASFEGHSRETYPNEPYIYPRFYRKGA